MTRSSSSHRRARRSGIPPTGWSRSGPTRRGSSGTRRSHDEPVNGYPLGDGREAVAGVSGERNSEPPGVGHASAPVADRPSDGHPRSGDGARGGPVASATGGGTGEGPSARI